MNYSFGGFQRFNSARSASMPAASIFAHSAGGSRIERRTMTSSGGLGGLPRGLFSCSMPRTVAPIYRYTNIPCDLDLSCYSNCIWWRRNMPFIRTVNQGGLVAKLSDEKLRALVAGMLVRPENYAASYIRAASAEAKRRADNAGQPRGVK